MSQQAERITLSAGKRTVTGKHVKQLRREGWVPGVMYGHGFESVSLQFEGRNLTRLLSRVGGSQLIQIDVEGAKEPEMALVRDVQRDPVKGTVLHVDFYRVQMTERLTAEIPLLLEGESPVIVINEGILLQGLSTIEVECLPGDLVDAIAVDLADLLEVDDSIHVKDLAIPSGIDVLTDPDELVVRVAPLAEEEIIEEIVEEELLLGEEGEVVAEGEEEEAEEAAGEGEEE
jgi:large subunit ribosomal protein L25